MVLVGPVVLATTTIPVLNFQLVGKVNVRSEVAATVKNKTGTELSAGKEVALKT